MISVCTNAQFYKDKEVYCSLNSASLSKSDKKEFVAYQKTDEGRSSNDSIELFEDLVFKSNFIKTFQQLIPRLELCGTEKVLEMGSGQGWASVLVKSKYPDSYVVASDLVPVALHFATKYEKALNTYIDEKWSFNCRDIPFEEGQFDRIFTFAAFHHFGDSGDYSKTINEMIRILKPRGKIILLYEPSSPKYLYNLAFKRVNIRRDIDGVDEDVLVLSKIKDHVDAVNCSFRAEFFPEYLHREGIMTSNYYYVLARLGKLQSLFVSTVNIVIEKI